MSLNKQDLLTAIESETDSTQLAILNAKLDIVQTLLNTNYRSLETLIRAKTFTSDSNVLTYLDSEIEKIKTEIANLTGSNTSS